MFLDMNIVVAILLGGTVVTLLIGNVLSTEAEYERYDQYQKLDYVIDMVNEIEAKLTLIEDMTMRLNIFEVFVYLAQKDVRHGLNEVDNWTENLKLKENLADISPYRGT